MIADLHAHYPMQLMPPGEGGTVAAAATARGRARALDRFRARLIALASRVANYETTASGPRVTIPGLRASGVGVALSVLYSPFDEMDLALRYGSPPLDRYLHAVLRQLAAVEAEIGDHHAGQASIAHNPAELDATLADGKVALVHCVEGGFHLGSTPQAIERAVTELASRGVAYITVAHLFYRGVAANAPAIPFLPDPVYRRLFPQPSQGLSELGRAMIEAMLRERVLIDLSHMSTAALEETFALLDRLDPAREVPVLASHVAYRFGHQEYNLNDSAIRRIAERDGVIGVILSEHQAADGLSHRPHPGSRRRRLLPARHTESIEDSLGILRAHFDRIGEVAGSHRHAAIGSDHDGFIKPTLKGLDDSSELGAIRRDLVAHYGERGGEAIASGNALRLLRGYWRS